MRNIIQIIIIALALIFIFVVPAAVIGDGLQIISGSVYPERIEIIHSLEQGDYIMSATHEDGSTYNVAFSGDGKTTRQIFDNIDPEGSDFVRAKVISDKEILWVSIDNDND